MVDKIDPKKRMEMLIERGHWTTARKDLIGGCLFCQGMISDGDDYFYISQYALIRGCVKCMKAAGVVRGQIMREDVTVAAKPYGSWNTQQRKQMQQAGTRLASVRKQLSRSRENLATAAGMSPDQLFQIEIGNRALTEREAKGLANSLGMTNLQFNQMVGFDVLPTAAVTKPTMPPPVRTDKTHIPLTAPSALTTAPPPAKEQRAQVPAPAALPALPSFDLNAFYDAYERTRREQQMIANLLVDLGLYDAGKSISDNVMQALKQQHERLTDGSQAHRAVKALESLRALISDELGAISS